MKITLTIFATLALLAYAVSGQEQERTVASLDLYQVNKDLIEVLNLIPRDNITEIANDHLAHDESFKAAIRYMQTPEWRVLMDSIRANPKWIALKEAVNKFGFDIDQLVNCTETFIENAEVGDVDPSAIRSLASFVKDVEEVIPIGQILVAFEKNKNLQSLMEHIHTDDFNAIAMDAFNVLEVRKYIQELWEMKLDVQGMLLFMFTALCWGKFEML